MIKELEEEELEPFDWEHGHSTLPNSSTRLMRTLNVHTIDRPAIFDLWSPFLISFSSLVSVWRPHCVASAQNGSCNPKTMAAWACGHCVINKIAEDYGDSLKSKKQIVFGALANLKSIRLCVQSLEQKRVTLKNKGRTIWLATWRVKRKREKFDKSKLDRNWWSPCWWWSLFQCGSVEWLNEWMISLTIVNDYCDQFCLLA